jgi:hypothetical protein
MGRKIIIPEDVIQKMIKLYVEDKVGTPTLSQMFNYGKKIINNTLKEKGVEIDTPGRRFLGGKSVSDSKYYKKNKGVILEKSKIYSKKNRSRLREYHTKWREKNREHLNEYSRNYEKNKKDSDPIYKLSCYIRTAMYTSIKERNINKYKSTFELLPYSLEELVKHLEIQFKDGMTWENYGEWHIDHIIPMSKFEFKSSDDELFKECWSLSNLQPMWGKENLSKNNKIIAHQYKIRLEKEEIEKKNLPFDINSITLKNATIKEISRSECEKIINEYEWLGYLPKYTKYHFGLFFNVDDVEYLGGVVALQPEYGDNVGVWDKYGFTNKIVQLSRGVCLWWTPKNSASFMISRVLKWLSKNTKYEVVSATVDSNAGEIGTIYQSLGWLYTGTMNGNLTPSGKERIRYGYKLNGKIYNQRHIRKMIGTASKEVVLKHFPDIEIINMGRKKRYFKFIKNEHIHITKIQHMLKPYPKR